MNRETCTSNHARSQKYDIICIYIFKTKKMYKAELIVHRLNLFNVTRGIANVLMNKQKLSVAQQVYFLIIQFYEWDTE